MSRVIDGGDLASIAESADPPLTTVHQDVEEMGRHMARLLVDDGASTASSVVVPTRLVLRQSARTRRRRRRSHSPAPFRPSCGITLQGPDRESIR